VEEKSAGTWRNNNNDLDNSSVAENVALGASEPRTKCTLSTPSLFLSLFSIPLCCTATEAVAKKKLIVLIC